MAEPAKFNGHNGVHVTAKLDAVVVGAGVAGLYQLYRLREQGLSVRAVDAASGVGGTWYWNLYKGWSWSEKFPGQPEIERWLNYVADRLDLR
jgi:acetone monooxygenase